MGGFRGAAAKETHPLVLGMPPADLDMCIPSKERVLSCCVKPPETAPRPSFLRPVFHEVLPCVAKSCEVEQFREKYLKHLLVCIVFCILVFYIIYLTFGRCIKRADDELLNANHPAAWL